MSRLRIPSATYRLQFSGQFRFEQARALAGYLDELGVTDIYASPLLQARRGSGHGYDVTNPTHLNAEVGSEQELEALATELRGRQMGFLLDIVPNHMVAGSENPWWMDVLEDGPGSAYASFFDIDWYPPRTITRNRVLLPILGRPYAAALENQELKLVFEQAGFFIYYFDTKLPVAPKSYLLVLQHRLDELCNKVGADFPAFRELGGILAATNNLPERTTLSTEMAGERRLQREAIKERLWNLCQITAKGVEDSALYVYNRLISLNDDPLMLAIGAYALTMQQRWSTKTKADDAGCKQAEEQPCGQRSSFASLHALASLRAVGDDHAEVSQSGLHSKPYPGFSSHW